MAGLEAVASDFANDQLLELLVVGQPRIMIDPEVRHG
ncbi:unannotated protein [freshwater metagenome]|uniref:Unannotated protein n=1 Tax=freshwater metagenome TaxID=449393 RepID=A0A6J7NP58_9ZZZZ